MPPARLKCQVSEGRTHGGNGAIVEGRTLTPDEAVAYALGESGGSTG